MLEVQQFIQDHPDNWKDILSQEPYNLRIKLWRDYIWSFSYNINSDFANPIVKECRGLFLYGDFSIAAMKMRKFLLWNDSKADKIDWDSSIVQLKYDGSLICWWYDKVMSKWQIGTNNTPFAEDAPLDTEGKYKTFYELAHEAITQTFPEVAWTILNKDYTYFGELVSPYNRIVVPYTQVEFYPIGQRNNVTLKEEAFDPVVGSYFLSIKEFHFSSIEECLEEVKSYDYNQEGLVVRDKYFSRIKIKAEDYLRVFKIRGETAFNSKRALDIIIHEQADDVLSIYPEYGDIVHQMMDRYNSFMDKLNTYVIAYISIWEKEQDRKKFATEFAMKSPYYPLFFALKDGKISIDNWREFVHNMGVDKFMKMIGEEK